MKQSPVRRANALLLALLVTSVAAVKVPILSSQWVGSAEAFPQNERDVRPLEVGKSIEREMRGGETHAYRLNLTAGQLLHAIVEQRGIDIVATLFGPDGKRLIEVDSPNGIHGPEPVWAIADASGDYRLEIHSPGNANPGRYEVKISELRQSTELDGKRVAAERAFMTAELLRSQGKLESIRRSIEKYEESLLIRQSLGDKPVEAIILSRIGETYYALGEPQKALEYFDRALPISRALKDRAVLATVLHSIGYIHDSTGDKKEALKYYEESLPIFEALKDRPGEASTLNKIGKIYGFIGEPRKALEYFNRALAISGAFEDRSIPAATLNNIGSIYNGRGDRKRALKYFNRALSLSSTIRDRSVLATTLNNLGAAYTSTGKKQEALKYYDRALPIFQSLKNYSAEAATLNNMGQVYHFLGENQKALECLNRALAISAAIKDRSVLAATLHSLGHVYGSMGDLQEAMKNYDQALSIRRAIQDRSGEATTLNNMADVYSLLGDKQRALECANRALSIRRAIQDRSGEAIALNNLGVIYYIMGNTEEALEYYKQALSIFQELGDLLTESSTLINIGMTYKYKDEAEEALKYMNRALSIRRSLQDPSGQAAALYNISSIYLETGKKEEALKYASQALLIFRQRRDGLGETAATGNVCSAYVLSGENHKAIGWCQQAVDKFETIRAMATIEEIKIGLSEHAALIYSIAILLRMSLGQHIDVFNLTERARARAFLDQIGNIHPNLLKARDAELLREERALTAKLITSERRLIYERNRPGASLDTRAISSAETELAGAQGLYESLLMRLKLTDSEYASLRSINTLTLPEVQRAIDKDTALLSYYVTNRKTLAFIIKRDSFRVVEIPVREQNLRGAISWFRNFSSLRDTRPGGLRQLYDWLIAPIKDYIDAPVVGIIPHGVLHYLPFAALTDGRQYFGDQHKIFYLPSASVLPLIRKKSKPAGDQMLAMAQSQAEGFPPLRHADGEAQAIADIYGTKAFLTSDASKSEFMKRAKEYDIIFIAAHAGLNTSSPLFSRIMLGADKDDTGALEVREVYGLDLSKASLVVLSACETYLGAHSSGDDIVGLNRAFIYAGTPAVVTSLWSVDDESTSFLMKEFFTRLKSGMSKVEALRAAQSETRKEYPHPYYWAGFVLTGDPG